MSSTNRADAFISLKCSEYLKSISIKMLNQEVSKKEKLTATRHRPIRCYESKKLLVWQMSVKQKIKINLNVKHKV